MNRTPVSKCMRDLLKNRDNNLIYKLSSSVFMYARWSSVDVNIGVFCLSE